MRTVQQVTDNEYRRMVLECTRDSIYLATLGLAVVGVALLIAFTIAGW